MGRVVSIKVARLQALTRFKPDLADQQPTRIEVQFDTKEPSDSVRYSNDDITSEVDQRVAREVEDDRVALICDATNAEVQNSSPKHPNLLRVHVVHMEPHSGEIPDALKLEEDLNKRLLLTPRSISWNAANVGWQRQTIGAVISPANPLVTLAAPVVKVLSEVGVTFDAVSQLTKTTHKVAVFSTMTVVGEVEQIEFGAAAVTFGHRVRQDAIW